MNLSKKIGFLLDTGFTPKFVSSLNENKINLLFEKMSKKENKEAQEITTKIKRFSPSEVADAKTKGESLPGGKAVKMNPDGSVDVTMEGKELEEDTINVVNDPDATADGMGMFETELSEKFESKAQQGLFWARCNKCKSENCKWCKMAKEFSKSTSKKQYKNMPEKKHPEKTVKYKKKETKENFTFKDYLGKLGSTYASQLTSKVTGPGVKFDESVFEQNLENIIQENLKPTMKKRDLLKLIESEIQRKKGLNEDFYYDEETELDEDFMMSDVDAPVKTPTRIKPKRETEPSEPEWEPEEDEPIIPSPDTDPEPQAKDDEDFFFKRFKKKFDKDLERMDEATHKPIKYRKF